MEARAPARWRCLTGREATRTLQALKEEPHLGWCPACEPPSGGPLEQDPKRKGGRVPRRNGRKLSLLSMSMQMCESSSPNYRRKPNSSCETLSLLPRLHWRCVTAERPLRLDGSTNHSTNREAAAKGTRGERVLATFFQNSRFLYSLCGPGGTESGSGRASGTQVKRRGLGLGERSGERRALPVLQWPSSTVMIARTSPGSKLCHLSPHYNTCSGGTVQIQRTISDHLKPLLHFEARRTFKS